MVSSEKQRSDLLSYDRTKLSSLLQAIQDADGTPVMLSNLKRRLVSYAKYLLAQQNQGCLPFVFGRNRDYWSEITEIKLLDFSSKAKTQ